MRTTKQIQQEFERVTELHQQSLEVIESLRALLVKADERLLEVKSRRWYRIIDNLEHALDESKARAAGYQQQLKVLERLLAKGAAGSASSVVIDDVAIDVPIDHLNVAERILSLSIDQLRSLTLDEVAALHQGMFDADEDAKAVSAEPSPRDNRRSAPKTVLEQRMERAAKRREAFASHRVTAQPSFGERRRATLLKHALEKVSRQAHKTLDLDEIEALTVYHAELTRSANLTSHEQNLLETLTVIFPQIERHASDLRRKRIQQGGIMRS